MFFPRSISEDSRSISQSNTREYKGSSECKDLLERIVDRKQAILLLQFIQTKLRNLKVERINSGCRKAGIVEVEAIENWIRNLK